MANNANSSGSLDNKEVMIGERAPETFLVFDGGLDDEVLEDTKARLLEELDYELDDRSISHGEIDGKRIATLVSVTQNHFGTFRHDRAEKVLEAITLALDSSQISLDVIKAPKDFKLN